MSEVAFHRKYRPKTLNEYKGERVKKILKTRFTGDATYPQTILLYGTRGCGKTSAARLIAIEYHCMNKNGGHACGECEMCLELQEKLINTEFGVDIIGVEEIDLADEGGKADMDRMLDEALIPPMYPLNYKVLILDEAHMATPQAQNRLLKIVEEPPKHLVFIFCTTDPDKIIGTLRSRCQLKIEVKKPTVDELSQILLEVCKKENITTSLEALKIIARKEDRIIREALNLLESVAKEYGYQVTVANVRDKTGEVATEIFMEYYQSANNSLEKIMLFTKKLKEQDISPKEFMRGLTRFTLDCIYIRCAIGIEDFPVGYVKEVKKFFNVYNSEELDLLLQIIEYGNKMIDADETKAELIIINTAMRIGKLKLLNEGLGKEYQKAEKENKESVKKYREIRKEEIDRTNVVHGKTADSALLFSVFGNDVIEIEGGAANIEIEEDREIESIGEISDEELISQFNS